MSSFCGSGNDDDCAYCDGTGAVSHDKSCEECDGTGLEARREPQDAASNAPQCSDASSQPTDVASCDSELAAIKAAWCGAEPHTRPASHDIRTLLRMVEELTEDNERLYKETLARRGFLNAARKQWKAAAKIFLRRWRCELIGNCNLTEERDDLRAKLETAVQALNDYWKNHGCVRHVPGYDHVRELEAKLATSEASQDAYVVEMEQLRAKLAETEKLMFALEAGVKDLEIERTEERERAEAAEARCRALEEERDDKANRPGDR